MYSVIIPTMWKSNTLSDLLNNLVKSDLIGEIIIIDNDILNTNKEIISYEKIKYHPQEKNIFVNPSWNLGVSKSKFENILILNDDILLSFDFLTNLKLEHNTIIGTDFSCYKSENKTFNLQNAEKRDWGWGCLLIFKKESWINIPDEMKIWCGDDFIFDRFENRRKIIGLPINTKMSTTSDMKEFDSIKSNDLKIYNEKYVK